LGVMMLLVMLERFLVYPAPSKADGDWSVPVGMEDAHFVSGDGTKLHGWFVEHPAAKAHVLFCHGNGEHVSDLGPWLRSLSDELQISVLAFDYRGYGRSEGKPFERGVLDDAEAAQKWLAERVGIQPQDVVPYGRSLGGGVAVHLASSIGARALVVERTFHSMVDIGAAQYPFIPVRWVMRNRYPSAKRIENYSGPLLQLHGTADTLIPLSSAKLLFEACPATLKQFIEVPGMGHNDASPSEFYDAFKELVNSL